jgi:hypothetical protein
MCGKSFHYFYHLLLFFPAGGFSLAGDRPFGIFLCLFILAEGSREGFFHYAFPAELQANVFIP